MIRDERIAAIRALVARRREVWMLMNGRGDGATIASMGPEERSRQAGLSAEWKRLRGELAALLAEHGEPVMIDEMTAVRLSCDGLGPAVLLRPGSCLSAHTNEVLAREWSAFDEADGCRRAAREAS